MWHHLGFEGLVIITAFVVPDLREILSRLLIFMMPAVTSSASALDNIQVQICWESAVDALSTFLVL